jgi:hypothetical protein
MAEWDAQVADEEIATCHICGQTFPTRRAVEALDG